MIAASHTHKAGFTAIELLITLFVAAFALATGYQLYAAVVSADGNTRVEASVSNKVHEELKKLAASAQNPCVPQLPAPTTTTIPDVGTVHIQKKIDCPNIDLPTMSRVTITAQYGNPEQTMSRSSYVTPGGI